MTISASELNRYRYQGNGSTDTFSFPARVFATTDIEVQIITRATDALVETLTISTHYTVTIAANGTASVQVTSAPKIPSASQDILLLRRLPLSQSLSLPTGTVFPAKSVENQLDRLTAITQDLSEELDRTLKLPEQSSLTSVELPIPEAGKALKWNATEDGLENTDVDIDDAIDEAATSATTATTQAGISTTQAGISTAAAAEAAQYVANLSGTSTSSVAIGTGTKVFTTQSGKFFDDCFVLITSDADENNYMHGLASYTGTTLTVDVTTIGGSGTLADWTIKVSGAKGATGNTGAAGSLQIANAGGTADAITADFSPDLTLADNLVIQVVNTAGANTVTNPTLNTDGSGALTIKARGNAALVAGDTGAAGYTMTLRYEATGTYWELQNPAKAIETDIVLADNTTNNASTTKHGFMPKLSNSATLYHDSLGTQTNPALNAVLTGYTSGAGTVAATDTILQAIQKLNGNMSAGSGGVTSIASGTLSTGSPTVVDITSIPQTYRALVLTISGASNSVNTRALRVDVNFGNGFGSANNRVRYTQILNATPTTAGVSAAENRLWANTTQASIEISSCVINFPAYQSGPAKTYNGMFNVAETAGTEFGTDTDSGFVTGVFINGTSLETRGLTGIRITWDNVGTGVFDGGTYSLYGVN